MDQSAFLE
ncbi:hypothetical protein F383_11686 [Gossypium arboreum]|uniref:Uncharacterized protein n=1 Tax=Gossypium arboreum TaxID=29729 RepID=A0A0B0NCB6_GOSAR|nr:hypothetical protein F383_35600 [Gossypium arboreum]KHG29030.1 hypothetical protein F383_11686 [Gossypium arboreum]